jgi:YYY domain-containing protein
VAALLIWWLILEAIGILALPLTLRLLRFLPDRGLGFARHVGLLVAGYLFWILVSLGILQNTVAGVLVVLALLAGLSFVVWRREGREMWAFLVRQRRLILTTESLFLAALIAMAFFRAYNPEIAATEKPMEFGFINGVLRSRTFPPLDPWLSGYAISYYHFGYVIVAMLTRLSGLASDVTFNLAVAMLFALAANAAFSVTYGMVANGRRPFAGYRARHGSDGALVGGPCESAARTGVLAAMLVVVIGNLEGAFELIRARGWGIEVLWRWLDVRNLGVTPPSATWYPDDGWWWWRASRVIHDRLPGGGYDEVISEFPFFSFLLGDVHPHVLALPFVMLALALALNVLLSIGRGALAGDAPGAISTGQTSWLAWLRRRARALWPGGAADIVLWGLLLGALGFLNTWDMPIYLGLFLVAYAIRRWPSLRLGSGNRQSRFPAFDRPSPRVWLADTVALGAVLSALCIGLYLPFYLGFRSQAAGLGWVGEIKTRPHQYLLMFGALIVPLVGWLAQQVWAYVRLPRGGRRLPPSAEFAVALLGGVMLASAVRGWWTAALTLALAVVAAALGLWGASPDEEDAGRTRLDGGSVLALLMVAAGLLLTTFTEFLFLRDTFGTRMNTVFKFYYQAWVLLAIGAAFGVHAVVTTWRGASTAGRYAWIAWAAVSLLVVAAGFSYTLAASASKANGFRGRPTLDGTRYVAEQRPDEYGAIQWLREHARPGAVMLEAAGGSYSEYNWVSAHSGVPTVLGWGGHELQWRGNYDEPGRREPDIAAIYQSTDLHRKAALLDEYGIDYVCVGPLERATYHLSALQIEALDRLMTRVYEQGDMILYAR